jgi:hypothetical protein
MKRSHQRAPAASWTPFDPSKLFAVVMPSFSKEVRFQCQGFPNNVLAVLCDFNDLYGLQIKSVTSKTFCPRRWSRAAAAAPELEVENGKSLAGTLARLSFFRKRKLAGSH